MAFFGEGLLYLRIGWVRCYVIIAIIANIIIDIVIVIVIDITVDIVIFIATATASTELVAYPAA